jgi:hypothetical protein
MKHAPNPALALIAAALAGQSFFPNTITGRTACRRKPDNEGTDNDEPQTQHTLYVEPPAEPVIEIKNTSGSLAQSLQSLQNVMRERRYRYIEAVPRSPVPAWAEGRGTGTPEAAEAKRKRKAERKQRDKEAQERGRAQR